MTDRELMQQALEALEFHSRGDEIDEALITVLRERLAQPEHEPVAWMNPSWIDSDTRGWASDSFESIQIEGWIPLYTAPRQWQGLTDEERGQAINANFGTGLWQMAKDLEAKLKEKNNGQ